MNRPLTPSSRWTVAFEADGAGDVLPALAPILTRDIVTPVLLFTLLALEASPTLTHKVPLLLQVNTRAWKR